MAPVTCPNCGSISASAQTLCPECSHPMRPRPGTAVAVHVSHRVAEPVVTAATEFPVAVAPHLIDDTEKTGGTQEAQEARATSHSTAEETAPPTGEAATPHGDGPVSAPGEAEPPPQTPHERIPRRATRVTRGLPGLFALAALVALVVMTFPGTQPPLRTEAHAKPTATATLMPTATPQTTPLPTPLPGYALYVDSRSEFMIQYPLTWSKEDLVPSIQFYDTAQSNYVVTILPADPNNGPATTDATAAATIWVDMTLNGIQQEETVQNFERLSGPTPAATIGGQVWQSGIATFGPADAPNRVQVYATIFDGIPYVITLVAPDDLFATGQALYFKPMLATFQFLPPSI